MSNNQKSLKENISVSLDSDLIIILKQLAEKDDRSLSQYINRVLRSHVNQIDKQNKIN